MAFGTFIAGEDLTPGLPLAVTAAGVVYKCCPTNPNTRNLAGISIDTVSAGGAVRVCFDTLPTDTFSDLVPGEQYYTGMTSGTILSGSNNFDIELQNTGYPSAYLNLIGTAITTTQINLERANPRLLQNKTANVILTEASSSAVTPMFILQEDGYKIEL